MSSRNPFSSCLVVTFVITLLLAWVVIWPFVRFSYSSNRHMTVRETIEFPIRETTFKLKHSRIGINPLVSEYSRDITFVSDSTIGRKTPLMIDGCGGYPINCYLLKNAGQTFVRLEDSVSEHLLDLDFQKTYVIHRHEGIEYVGEIEEETMSRGWSIANNDPSTFKVTIGRQRGVPIDEITHNARKTYIGSITGGLDRMRFVPVSESPERPIRRRQL